MVCVFSLGFRASGVGFWGAVRAQCLGFRTLGSAYKAPCHQLQDWKGTQCEATDKIFCNAAI